MFVKTTMLLSILIVLLTTACSDNQTGEVERIKGSNVIKKKLPVTGMTCVGCEVTLEKAISKVHGVVKVKASASNDEVQFSFDKTKTDAQSLTKMIKDLGYKTSKNQKSNP